MASHVVVLDSSARRAVIKTTPGKYLSDVLSEACGKLGLDASQNGLKHNGKTVDLSRTIRLSNISSGAKLELVVLSRSAFVVSIALQLPESEAHDVPNGRLTDKFPSTTTLWLVLRKFESGVAGGLALKRNFTARGMPQMGDSTSSAGRLYHESPVIQVMGRELVSFLDFQKTLGQLGFNGGSALLRLSFRVSQTPFEEAMEQTQKYFESSEDGESKGVHADSLATTEIVPDISQARLPEDDINRRSPPEPISPPSESTKSPAQQPSTEDSEAQDTSSALPSSSLSATDGHSLISVFAPPSSTTPYAARHPHNESDYEPTLDHAKLHQSRLSTHAQNKRLLGDAELAAEQTAKAQKRAEVKEIDIKVRFPDQATVVVRSSESATARSLYEFVRVMLNLENEPFFLNFSAAKGPKQVPRDSSTKLIEGLGLTGKVLINFIWDSEASAAARTEQVLKVKFYEVAKEIEVPEVQAVEVAEQPPAGEGQTLGTGKEKGKGKGGVPKWMRLPGKK